jgi:hypothetical protein
VCWDNPHACKFEFYLIEVDLRTVAHIWLKTVNFTPYLFI